MRTRIKDYKIVQINDNSAYLYVNRPKDYPVNNVAEAIRLIINETKHIPITSSMTKDIVGTISNYTATEQIPFNTQITLNKTGAFSSANFNASDDKFTVEFDWAVVSAEDIFVDFDSDMASEIDLIIGSTEQLSGTSTETSISNLRTLVQLNGVLLSEVATEANATSNKQELAGLINSTLASNIVTTGIMSMAGIQIVDVPVEDTTLTALPNRLYRITGRTGTGAADLTISFGDDQTIPSTEVKEWHFIFEGGATSTITWDDFNNNAVMWQQGLPPQLSGGQGFYEVGILNGVGLWMSYAASNN